MGRPQHLRRAAVPADTGDTGVHAALRGPGLDPRGCLPPWLSVTLLLPKAAKELRRWGREEVPIRSLTHHQETPGQSGEFTSILEKRAHTETPGNTQTGMPHSGYPRAVHPWGVREPARQWQGTPQALSTVLAAPSRESP